MKFGAVLGLFSFVCLQTSCQSGPEKNADDRTLLWQVSGNGLSKPSYFFGTMHILCKDESAITPNFKKVIDNVGQVYLEIDMDDLVQMIGGMGDMAMKDGKKLSDLYSEADLAKIKAWFQAQGQMPYTMLEHFKPMLLSSMVSEAAMSCEAKDGMEMRIMELAQQRKLEIKGLETMAFQAGLIDSIPYEEQAKDLLEAIDSVEVQQKMMERLVKAYRSQDLDSLDALTKEDEGGVTSKYLDLMLYNRNRNWVAQFKGIASKMPTLFAVGAAHLTGEKGVLNLLRQQGYTLTPMLNK